ncbi:hypothetical protein [Nocardioides sp. NPDC004968]|uniref:hypothetical protein n=1 Tax=Nocardioides sp. NPDC004968 TaxID=3155894 RepID=UPI0033B4E9D8
MTMLAIPNVPFRSNGAMDAETLAEVAGTEAAEPLRQVERAYGRAQTAVRELRDNRPGEGSAYLGTGRAAGKGWAAAANADAADAAEERIPADGWRTAALLAGDDARWADAAAAVRALPIVERRAEAALDREAIAAAAAKAAAAAVATWAAEAEQGWSARHDPAEAWNHRRAGEAALGDWRQARRVETWAQRKGETPAAMAKADLSGASYLPEGPAARGCWLALGLMLKPGQVWPAIPNDVTFPEDMPEKLLDAVMPGGKRQVDLTTTGHHAHA